MRVLSLKSTCATFGVFVLISGGCAITNTSEKSELKIYNLSNESIAEVLVKGCESNDENYTAILRGFKSGYNFIYNVNQPCIDVKAIGRDGKVVAKQNKLELPPAVRWIIR